MLPGIRAAALASSGILATYGILSGQSGTAPDRKRGFSVPLGIGSIDLTTAPFLANSLVYEMYHNETSGVVAFSVQALVSNSGWTTMTVDGTSSFTRASATYAQGGGVTSWSWTNANVFGLNGSTHTVVFT